ncbi:Fibrinogen C domain-containing protein 1-B [Holothuria leucospilota]|uniref:Fibrinogen C domain-containing protein 1-B n=1 Tax=Holothuria leucospilota TaxID=206669 RepID=A0A9Q1C020_HOLLE|nr:Fibrinogen C domain-containing protein 1-B [Holothuria leucospilota]
MACLILLQMFSIFWSSLLVQKVHSSTEGSSYFFYQQPAYPRDCQEVFQQCTSNNASGVYLIKPDGYEVAFEVYCDNHLDGGGWTVFQRRQEDNTVEFGRTFSEYREGFGFLSGEFWLGNEKLSLLTNQKRYQLRIDMTNSAGSSFYVTYDLFRISDDWGNYKLTSVGQYNGTADAFISQGPASTPSAPSTPTDCYDVFTSGSPDGVYTIQPNGWTGSPFEVYCNMSHGGGWTVFQRRVDGSVSFNHNWDGYKAGFGSAGPNENVWLGNEILYNMTNQKNYKLRIDVVKQDLVDWHMNYDLFRVNSESNNYRLELGTYTGNAGYDYMSDHRGQDFSTPDRDNDAYSYNCATIYDDAGWWYKNCYTANLNNDAFGGYYFALYKRDTGTYHYYLRYSQMKFRPI